MDFAENVSATCTTFSRIKNRGSDKTSAKNYLYRVMLILFEIPAIDVEVFVMDKNLIFFTEGNL
jgi:hypothetical protein